MDFFLYLCILSFSQSSMLTTPKHLLIHFIFHCDLAVNALCDVLRSAPLSRIQIDVSFNKALELLTWFKRHALGIGEAEYNAPFGGSGSRGYGHVDSDLMFTPIVLRCRSAQELSLLQMCMAAESKERPALEKAGRTAFCDELG
jgi:hypothetical protein